MTEKPQTKRKVGAFSLYYGIQNKRREEKVKLGTAAMEIMYYFAEQLLKTGKAFILENNFENASREGLLCLLEKYNCSAVTITLTGEYPVVYRRFLERNESPDRHLGHVVNDRYPRKGKETGLKTEIPFEAFVNGIKQRGMDSFCANGPHIVVDTTDFSKVDWEKVADQLEAFLEGKGIASSKKP